MQQENVVYIMVVGGGRNCLARALITLPRIIRDTIGSLVEVSGTVASGLVLSKCESGVYQRQKTYTITRKPAPSAELDKIQLSGFLLGSIINNPTEKVAVPYVFVDEQVLIDPVDLSKLAIREKIGGRRNPNESKATPAKPRDPPPAPPKPEESEMSQITQALNHIRLMNSPQMFESVAKLVNLCRRNGIRLRVVGNKLEAYKETKL